MWMRFVTSEPTDIGGTLLTVHEDGVMVACLEYFWVKNLEDLRRADRGERPEGGDVLYVTNIATARPGSDTMQLLKQHLPPHRYIAGLRLTTPKGVPDGFYTPLAVPMLV